MNSRVRTQTEFLPERFEFVGDLAVLELFVLIDPAIRLLENNRIGQNAGKQVARRRMLKWFDELREEEGNKCPLFGAYYSIVYSIVDWPSARMRPSYE